MKIHTKKILITGGTGFLGGHLLSQGHSRYKIVTTYHQSPHYDITNVEWRHLKLSKIETITSLIQDIKPDVIIHPAAISSVDLCEQQPQLAELINVQATVALAKAAAKHGIRFVFLSSDMVYDGETGLYSENDDVNPINYYGYTKVQAEEKIKDICPNHVIVRTAIIYGTVLANAHSFSDEMLHQVQNQRQVNLFYDQFRSPILVNNLAEAVFELADSSIVGTLNLGGKERISRYDFGMKMAHCYNFSTQLLNRCSMDEFRHVAKRPRDVSLNIKKVLDLLKTSMLSCEEGLELCVKKQLNSVTEI
jgi:dTDP-4-dehydrorhamnose reductase